jgi:hypothetical protein
MISSVSYFHDSSHDQEFMAMSDLDRGIMKFEGADKPVIVATSAIIVLGSITALIFWAVKVAYAVH